MRLNQISDTIQDLIADIVPFDSMEEDHILETLSWIKSGAPIFRTQKPDVPKKHLVSYFVLVDELCRKILLVAHKKAGLWLPTGGHVELNEHPHDTVIRECFEELNTAAKFWAPDPLFLTVSNTVGLTSGHTDVSLWYVLTANSRLDFDFDKEEFEKIAWFEFKDIPYQHSDPHLSRFIQKLEIELAQALSVR